MHCELCGKDTDDYGDVNGAVVCPDCTQEALDDQGLIDDGINGFKKKPPKSPKLSRHFIHVVDLEYVAKQYAEYREWEKRDGEWIEEFAPGGPDWDCPTGPFEPGRITCVESAICEHARKASYINVTTGCEGPRHDPYGYTETTVTINDQTVTIHSGLVVSIEINEAPLHMIYGRDGDKVARRIFKRLTGMFPEDWETYWAYRVYVEDPMGSLGDYE